MKLRQVLPGILGLMLVHSTSTAAWARASDTVVLLHGLGRTRYSMSRLGSELERAGFQVVNLSYPSRTVPLETLAHVWLPAEFAELETSLAAVSTCSAPPPAESSTARTFPAPAPPIRTARIHLVTHSMGGVLVRLWLRDSRAPASLGRVVMLAPPNAGSEISDRLDAFPPFRWFTGVNGRRLGTARDALPQTLGPWPVAAELGIVAGNRSLNPLFSHWLPGPDDGKVTVRATHLAGQRDHAVLPHSHPWLAWRRQTASYVIAFLRTGSFADAR